MANSPIEFSCNAKNAYNFRIADGEPIGHLVKLSFETGGTLDQDVEVDDPLNPGNKIKVVGILDHIYWPADGTEPVDMRFRVSNKNKPLISVASRTSDGSTDMKAEWIIYEYDGNTKKYHKAFHTNKKEINCVRTSGRPPHIENVRSREIQEPENYVTQLSLTGKGKQELTFAGSPGHNLQIQFGTTA